MVLEKEIQILYFKVICGVCLFEKRELSESSQRGLWIRYRATFCKEAKKDKNEV